jgi:hypothetical protein
LGKKTNLREFTLLVLLQSLHQVGSPLNSGSRQKSAKNIGRHFSREIRLVYKCDRNSVLFLAEQLRPEKRLCSLVIAVRWALLKLNGRVETIHITIRHSPNVTPLYEISIFQRPRKLAAGVALLSFGEVGDVSVFYNVLAVPLVPEFWVIDD